MLHINKLIFKLFAVSLLSTILYFVFDYKGLINYVTECYIDELGCHSDDKQDELTKMKESIDLIR